MSSEFRHQRGGQLSPYRVHLPSARHDGNRTPEMVIARHSDMKLPLRRRAGDEIEDSGQRRSKREARAGAGAPARASPPAAAAPGSRCAARLRNERRRALQRIVVVAAVADHDQADHRPALPCADQARAMPPPMLVPSASSGSSRCSAALFDIKLFAWPRRSREPRTRTCRRPGRRCTPGCEDGNQQCRQRRGERHGSARPTAFIETASIAWVGRHHRHRRRPAGAVPARLCRTARQAAPAVVAGRQRGDIAGMFMRSQR